MQFLKPETTDARFSFPFFFQPYENQVSEARSTYTDTDGPSESGFSSQGEDYSFSA